MRTPVYLEKPGLKGSGFLVSWAIKVTPFRPLALPKLSRISTEISRKPCKDDGFTPCSLLARTPCHRRVMKSFAGIRFRTLPLAQLQARRETCGTVGQLTKYDCRPREIFRILQSLRLGLSIPVIFAGVAPVSVGRRVLGAPRRERRRWKARLPVMAGNSPEKCLVDASSTLLARFRKTLNLP